MSKDTPNSKLPTIKISRGLKMNIFDDRIKTAFTRFVNGARKVCNAT